MEHLTGKNNEGPSSCMTKISGPVIIQKKLQGCKFLFFFIFL